MPNGEPELRPETGPFGLGNVGSGGPRAEVSCRPLGRLSRFPGHLVLGVLPDHHDLL